MIMKRCSTNSPSHSRALPRFRNVAERLGYRIFLFVFFVYMLHVLCAFARAALLI